MGCDNLEILADNFQVPGRWASRRYDAVFGHGVFYDCVDPFYLFDQLTRISDTIFIGGWVASDGTRLSEWRSMRYVPHFLAGLTTRSICRDPEGIDDSSPALVTTLSSARRSTRALDSRGASYIGSFGEIRKAVQGLAQPLIRPPDREDWLPRVSHSRRSAAEMATSV